MAAESALKSPPPPRSSMAPLNASLFVPAYAALFVATAVAGYILAYHIDSTAFSGAFGLALVLAVGATFAANHANEGARFTAQWLRFVTVPVLLAITVVSNPDVYFSQQFYSDANTIVAGYLGLVVVLCILLIGLSIEGRPVPIAMPLVATLGLFGLLNLILVDTIVQVGFALFTAAGLFLVGYERLLGHWQKRRATHSHDENLSDEHLHRAMMRFFGACIAWFTLLLTSSAVLYQPLYAVLPGIVPAQLPLNRSQSNSDFRNSPRQVEVRGGNHLLSEREVLRVRVLKGNSPGLWRGRVFQNYEASTWRDDDGGGLIGDVLVEAGTKQYRLSRLRGTESLPVINEKFGTVEKIEAEIEMLVAPGTPHPIFTGGRPVAIKAPWGGMLVNRHTGVISMNFSPFTYLMPGMPAIYTVQGEYIDPLNAATRDAPGLSEAERRAWMDNPDRVATLELPNEPMLRDPLQRIANEINARAAARGQQLRTPVQKMLAINTYLHDTCVYSLSAPSTPSTQDGVIYFMTTSREGACDMFASAMALLLRQMGVPARMVTGYLEPDSSDATGNRSEFTLRERDAHAWVEYWVPQIGWLTSDPSSGTRLADDSWLSQFKATLASLMQRMGGATVLLPVLGVLFLTAGLFWPKLEAAFGRGSAPANAHDARRENIRRTYAQATRLVRRHIKGRRTAPFTPRELDDAIGNAPLPPEAKQEFSALTYLHAAANYSAETPDVTEQQLRDSLARLKSALR